MLTRQQAAMSACQHTARKLASRWTVLATFSASHRRIPKAFRNRLTAPPTEPRSPVTRESTRARCSKARWSSKCRTSCWLSLLIRFHLLRLSAQQMFSLGPGFTELCSQRAARGLTEAANAPPTTARNPPTTQPPAQPRGQLRVLFASICPKWRSAAGAGDEARWTKAGRAVRAFLSEQRSGCPVGRARQWITRAEGKGP